MSKKTRQEKKLQRQQKQQLQRDELQKANAEATAVLKTFLRVPPLFNTMNNPAWHLHVLCRTGDEGTFGFQDSELDYYHFFIGKLISFFLQSDNAKRFNKHMGNDRDLGERLGNLSSYFDSLIHSPQVKAELELIDTEHFASLSKKECERIVYLYSREKRLAEAKRAAFFPPKTKAAA